MCPLAAALVSDPSLTVLVCQLASANTLTAWHDPVSLRDVLVAFAASCGE